MRTAEPAHADFRHAQPGGNPAGMGGAGIHQAFTVRTIGHTEAQRIGIAQHGLE